MMSLRRFFSVLFVSIFFTGCSITPDAQRSECMIDTTLAGTATGAAASPLGAGLGTLAGSVFSHYLCDKETDTRDVATPKPKPVETTIAKEEDSTGRFLKNDGDNDGVLDSSDLCLNTPAGVAVDAQGCANDSDGDGVPDYRDQCAETPLGTVVATNGCSLAMRMQAVLFEFNSANLTAEGKRMLDEFATDMQKTSDQIAVEGYTDDVGTESYNLDLSQRRAESVAKYLVSKGVNRDRLDTRGFGESSPVASNETDEGRAQNRRVELSIRQ